MVLYLLYVVLFCILNLILFSLLKYWQFIKLLFLVYRPIISRTFVTLTKIVSIAGIGLARSVVSKSNSNLIYLFLSNKIALAINQRGRARIPYWLDLSPWRIFYTYCIF